MNFESIVMPHSRSPHFNSFCGQHTTFERARISHSSIYSTHIQHIRLSSVRMNSFVCRNRMQAERAQTKQSKPIRRNKQLQHKIESRQHVWLKLLENSDKNAHFLLLRDKQGILADEEYVCVFFFCAWVLAFFVHTPHGCTSNSVSYFQFRSNVRDRMHTDRS